MSLTRSPRRGLHEPSLRALRIYRHLVHEGLRQTTLAQMYGITQGRVSQTARRVRHWVDLTIGKSRTFRQRPDLRFFLAIAQERLRLEQSCEPLLAMFDERAGKQRYVRRHIAVIDGQPIPTIEITDLPSHRFFAQSADLVARLAELESVAQDGPFAHLTADQLQIIIHRHVGAERDGDETTGTAPTSDNRSASTSDNPFYPDPPGPTPFSTAAPPAPAPNTTPHRSAESPPTTTETLLFSSQPLISSPPPSSPLAAITPSPQ